MASSNAIKMYYWWRHRAEMGEGTPTGEETFDQATDTFDTATGTFDGEE